jgi:hypothetical protein
VIRPSTIACSSTAPPPSPAGSSTSDMVNEGKE